MLCRQEEWGGHLYALPWIIPIDRELLEVTDDRINELKSICSIVYVYLGVSNGQRGGGAQESLRF
jgi:hypothetical protein